MMYISRGPLERTCAGFIMIGSPDRCFFRFRVLLTVCMVGVEYARLNPLAFSASGNAVSSSRIDIYLPYQFGARCGNALHAATNWLGAPVETGIN